MKLWTGLFLLLSMLGTLAWAADPFPATPTQTIAVGKFPYAVVVFDRNIAVANNGANSVTILTGSCTNSTTCNYSPKPPIAVGAAPTSIDKGQFRGGAALPDLVTANNAAGTLSILLQRTPLTFFRYDVAGVGVSPQSVAVADYNQDGFDDIALTNSASAIPRVTLLMNQGNCTGNSCKPKWNIIALPDLENAVMPWGLANGKFKDGKAIDLVVANFYSNNYGMFGADVLINRRKPTGDIFKAAVALPGGFYAPYVATGHFTSASQTHDDFAITNYGGEVLVFINDGDGNFPGFAENPTGITPMGIAKLEDINTDGIDDIAFASFYGNFVSILKSVGGGGNYTQKQQITVGTNPITVLEAKLGNTGARRALIVVNRSSNNIMLFQQ